jgi:hypothetical protein
MELEPSFYRLHVRLLDGYTRKVAPSSRKAIEWCLFATAVALLLLLAHLHVMFVGSSACLDRLLQNHGKPGGYTAQVVHITVSGSVANVLRGMFERPTAPLIPRSSLISKAAQCPAGVALADNNRISAAFPGMLWFLPATSRHQTKSYARFCSAGVQNRESALHGLASTADLRAKGVPV